MNTTSIRFSIAGALGIATLASFASVSGVRAASADEHPDFAWWPTGATSNRLYVGGLSGSIGRSDVGVYFNPKELTIDKPVPWR